MIDSKDIKKGSWRSNPFARRSIKCTTCGTEIKPKAWLFALWWSWVALGIYFMFSKFESPYIYLVILGTLGVMVSLMRFGLSHESE